MQWMFDTPNRVQLVVENGVGSVVIASEDTSSTQVTLEPDGPGGQDLVERATVECTPFGDRDVVVVKVPHRYGARFVRRGVSVRVVLPSGSDVTVTCASADTDLIGDFGELSIVSASGDVDADGSATEAKVKTASGGITLGAVSGSVRFQSASGDIRVSSVDGPLTVATASGEVEVGFVGDRVNVRGTSGDIRLGQVLGDADIMNVSGDVRVIAYGEGLMNLRTVSGTVSVGIPPGVSLSVDVESASGAVESEIPLTDTPDRRADGPAVGLRIRTVSGDVVIERAAAAMVA